MRRKSILSLLLIFAVVLTLTFSTAGAVNAAPDWPRQIIRQIITIVVPFTAGSSTDLCARYLAASLQKVLGATIVIENVTGSGGWIGWNQVMYNAKKDGYTLGAINHNFALGAYDDAAPRKETLKDVQLLANQVFDGNVLAIRANEKRFKDVKSFIEYAKKKEIMISAQSTGILDGDATTAQWFVNQFGCKIVIVPVDGASDGRKMFMAGDTDVYFGNVSDVYRAHNNGELKTICVFSSKRSEFLPNVPTISELGVGKFESFSARGYFFPKGVDKAIVEKMQAAMLKAMEDPDYKAKMTASGFQVHPLNAADCNKLLTSQLETRKKI